MRDDVIENLFEVLCHRPSDKRDVSFAMTNIGPLSLLIVNGFFIKLHSAITASFSLGWLVKLFVAAMAVVILLG